MVIRVKTQSFEAVGSHSFACHKFAEGILDSHFNQVIMVIIDKTKVSHEITHEIDIYS